MFCPACGVQALDGAKFCAGCGAALAAPAAAVAPANRSAASGEPVHAGFWRRYAAAMVDVLIVSLVLAPFLYHDVFGNAPISLTLFVAPPLIFFYSVLFEWLLQATPGKFAAGIKVTGDDGERITFGRAALRLLGKLVMLLTAGIALIAAAFHEKRRSLDDMIAGTLVVARGASPAAIIRAPSKAMAATAAVAALAVAFTIAVPAAPILVLQWALSQRTPYPPPEIRAVQQDMREFYGAPPDPKIRIIPSAVTRGGSAPGSPD